MNQEMELRHPWKYTNLTLLALGIVGAYFLTQTDLFGRLLMGLGDVGYIGAFFVGMFFVFTFTAAVAAVALFALAESVPLLPLSIIAGLGGVVGDFLILRFVKDNIEKEVFDISHHVRGANIIKIFHSKYFSWMLPVLGAIIIASPFPDELGVSLLGISKMRTSRFLVLSFVLNTVGIFLVVSAAKLISE